MESAPSPTAGRSGPQTPSALALAFDRPTVIGGLKVAAVVGTVLNLINQGDRLLSLRPGDVVWWRIALTYSVPFCVSVFSATRIRLVDRQRRAEAAEIRAAGGDGSAPPTH